MSLNTLAALPLFQSAYIDTITIRGDLRRRLLDLGFTPGSIITPPFVSPLGDPTAYAVMGSIIALRKEDAKNIQILPLPKEARQ